jgi:hypothetical protein
MHVPGYVHGGHCDLENKYLVLLHKKVPQDFVFCAKYIKIESSPMKLQHTIDKSRDNLRIDYGVLLSKCVISSRPA